jgi:hypothetical protein
MSYQTIRTHNAYHLGDNLVHLNFLRRVALANPDLTLIHHVQWQYINQLRDVVVDIPNIHLAEFNYHLPAGSIDAWRGADGFWYQHPDRNDFVKFHTEAWFPHLAARMGVGNPVTTREDMLFDYPALDDKDSQGQLFDVLIINSPPGSGQFLGYDEFALCNIANALATAGHDVVVTHLPLGWQRHHTIESTTYGNRTVTEIGRLSQHCHTILMVSTGPSWPTFNVLNKESVKNRFILLDTEFVDLAPNTHHCSSVSEAEKLLRDHRIL